MALAEARMLMTAGPGDVLDRIPPAPLWMRDGACREHPEVEFVPVEVRSDAYRRRLAEAVSVCRGCLVRRECLAYALDDPVLVGVWGGSTAEERRALARPSKAGL